MVSVKILSFLPPGSPTSALGNWTGTVFSSKCLVSFGESRAGLLLFLLGQYYRGLPGGSDGTASACSAGNPGSIPGSGRPPGGGDGTPLQCSCLENPMDRGAWWATVHEVAKSRTRLSDFTYLLIITIGGFTVGSVIKNPCVNTGDMSLTPGSGRSLEEEMATHSSTLAWKISRTEEPGGLQSTGWQRVRPD